MSETMRERLDSIVHLASLNEDNSSLVDDILAALRDPTEAMNRAGVIGLGEGDTLFEFEAEMIWQRMLDAVAEPTP